MITIQKCPCGQEGCDDYHLVGIGHFVVGSGFRGEEEAQRVATAINCHDELVAVARELLEADLPTDTFCEHCGAEAEKVDVDGRLEVGPLPHANDCTRAAAEAILAKAEQR